MSAKVLVLTLLTLFILGVLIFRYRAGVGVIHIDPHAAAEIEKAKQR